jgi:mannose-6-phosphate isomerase
MVIPERTSKSGITLPDKKMHGGLGFEKMFDCFIYNGCSEDELKAKYVRHPKLTPNALTPVVDGALTEKFRMDCALVNGVTSVEYKDKYAVAVVIDGNCEIESKMVKTSLKAGDELFITADEGEFILKGTATLMICTPNI